jgi:SAM-dependent methyltransferase
MTDPGHGTRHHDGGSWDAAYRVRGDAPWDSGRPSEELIRTVDEERVLPGRAVELGCGTGTNAIFLAQAGFDVTGIDISGVAVAEATAKAGEVGVAPRFIVADLLDPPPLDGPYDFLFDRGCYHVLRSIDVDRYLTTLESLVRPGSQGLFLTGNAREPSAGPPVVSEAELRAELGRIFVIVRLREFRFDLRGSSLGMPLAWSCFVRRPPDPSVSTHAANRLG